MKNQLRTQNYLFILLLLAAALLLAACGTTTDTVSAAKNDLVNIEETIAEAATVAESVETIDSDDIQKTPADDDIQNSEAVASTQAMPNNGNGPASNGQAGPGQGEHITPAGDLSENEIAALMYMREEEKLARDVYQTLYDVWGVPVFANIASSEQAHMDAVAYLLESYGLGDPVAGKVVGDFTNPELQTLYDELIDQGQSSLEAALLVGGAIEEIDILDLQERLAQTNNEAITQVFENLLAGSVNHLGAFTMNLERQTGTVYEPQYLSQDEYKALLSATSGRGNGPGGGNNNGGQGPGNNGGQGGNGGGQSGNGGGQGNGNGRGRNG